MHPSHLCLAVDRPYINYITIDDIQRIWSHRILDLHGVNTLVTIVNKIYAESGVLPAVTLVGTNEDVKSNEKKKQCLRLFSRRVLVHFNILQRHLC